MIKTLHIRNLLSFGDGGVHIDLKPLNVLIGPNASGKSNLIEVLGLLHSTPKDFPEPTRKSGGISEWLWKGSGGEPTASIDVTADLNQVKRTLRYLLSFSRIGYQLEITDERIENASADAGKEMPYFYFHFDNGRPMLNVRGEKRFLRREEVNPQQSVLAQRKDPDQYPELTYLGQFFGAFRLYRDWEFGPESRARDVYAADLPNDFLEEDASNLGLMLNKIQTDPKTRTQLRENLKAFSDEAEDIILKVEGGWVEIRLEEKTGISIPQVRLSDGTLRWLSLLTILLHPSPPPLVCIEEPELGLHPDMIRPLAKLLVDASERMQLVVTTHSDALVDELTDRPDSVIVCEKEGGSSTLKRLGRADLSSWLERYSLGQLWRTGEIGGNRW